MIAKIDYVLDRVTMYRLVLYVLLGLLGLATILSYFKLLSFSPLALVASTIFLVIMCWAMNTVLARVFAVPVNVESASITALILALIIDPAQSPGDFQFLGWAAILAMSSKYILAMNKKHLFNPAAIAVVITAFVLGKSASWWVGTTGMLPLVLLGGWLVARKIRQEDVVIVCCAVALVCSCVMTFVQGSSILTDLKQMLIGSPLFFFATIMLTEPLTAPPTKNLRRLYAALVGILFIPQAHIGTLYSTPELALVFGNVFSYLVSPKSKVMLKLNKRVKMAPGVMDFVLKPSQRLAFVPGQYMEFTLDHTHPDSRGNRRYFTLASSPTEKLVHLGIRFYEQGSTFKRAMYKMDGRTKFVAAQIAGDFTLPTDPRQKLVFIAGGIGITPFRSMLKYLLDVQQRRDIVLFYINKTADEIVYADVLNAAQAKLGVKTCYTLTDTTAVPRNWPGFVGRLNEQIIQSVVPDYRARTYYLSGPPEMVRACEHVLKSMHVKNDQIKKDFFPGLV
jgi:ferredoxin-NADP reductase/Na+-translocating ferredoxin:NAD+ oxidoreductase RnfD subunit